jgi:hypothetical protein
MTKAARLIDVLEEVASMGWRELSKMDHPNTGQSYTIWISKDPDTEKPIYQATTGKKPMTGDGGYYELKSLLKLKGL